MTSPRAGLLVVGYGSHDLVAENLARTEVPDDTAVFVVDNRTTDAERARMELLAAARGWTLVSPETNLGFGAGMNAAAAAALEAGASVLIALNPDAYIAADGVSRLADAVAADPCLMIAPLVERPDGGHFSSEMELDMDSGAMRRLREPRRYARSELWLSGACFAIGRELWQRVGGFDDDYFLYWEDVDLSVRVARAGGRLRVDHGIIAVHAEGGTQSEEGNDHRKSPLYYFYNIRNRYVFAAQHLDRDTQKRWRRGAVRAAWDILMRGGRRQLLHPARTVVPAVRGTFEGFAYMRRRAREASA